MMVVHILHIALSISTVRPARTNLFSVSIIPLQVQPFLTCTANICILVYVRNTGTYHLQQSMAL